MCYQGARVYGLFGSFCGDLPVMESPLPYADGRRLAWLPVLVILAIWSSACLPLIACDPAGSGISPNEDEIRFEAWFLPSTMRVDYYHSGTATEDRIALDRVVREGAWAGRRSRLAETLDLGLYRLEVRDAASDRVIFANGFCSVFGEWQTTAPAKTQWGTFHASLRFPWPQQSVAVVILRRGEDAWHELWKVHVDPESRFVFQAEAPPDDGVWNVLDNGPPAEKLDLVFLGDGYTAAEQQKFHADVRRLTERLFTEEPWRSRRDDINVHAVDVVSPASGITRPRDGAFLRTALDCQYNVFDLERYALTLDNRTLREVAAAAPYDYLVILLNSNRYGGGGILNDQATVAADSTFADYILVHELGHHLAGLGDEYYVAQVAYETGRVPRVEPWEPNLTALLAPAGVKWHDLVLPDTPIPTPWSKEAYETAAHESQQRRRAREALPRDDVQLEADFREERQSLTQLLAANEFAGRIGAFEGAGYETRGLYRPAIDCLMFSRNEVGFCAVCRRAIERMIDLQTGRP
jgi:hypothetical protein